MKYRFVVLLASAGLIASGGVGAGQAEKDPPRKPKPAWVGKMVDQGQHDPRLKGYLMPEGFKMEVVADFPAVVNPVGMAFGPDGTLHVIEWAAPADGKVTLEQREFTYKDGSTRKVAVLKKSVRDRIKILTRKEGKATFDEARVVLEEDMPSSILFHDGYLYVSGRGTVRRYQPTGPAGSYGKAEVIAQGFGGFGHRQVSGLTLGNDDWLYITVGAGDHHVEGSDGSRVDVLRTGAVFRCRPDGSKLQLFAQGFRNPYRDVAIGGAGNLFHIDGGMSDGSKFAGCRLLHLSADADYGWRCLPGSNGGKVDAARAAGHGELPGRLPPMRNVGPGEAAGLFIYNDAFLPPEYRGLLYWPDVLGKVVRAYEVRPKGASFEVAHEFDLCASTDKLFCPSQLVLGPDVGMYLCDWRNESAGAAKPWGDGKHGRIYRIWWSGTKNTPAIPLRGLDSWAKIIKQTDAELFKTLASENFSDRQKAQQELVRRGDKHRPALIKLLEDEKQSLPARIAALGALQSMWNDDVAKAFQGLIGHPQPDLCRLIADGLALNAKRGDKAIHQDLVSALNDPNPAVKRALALAIGTIGAEGAADPLVNLLKFDTGKDRFLHDGILRGIERLGKPGIDGLLSLANSGDDKDLATAVKAFAALRSPAAANALPDLLKNVHLTSQEKVALVRSFNNYVFDPPLMLDPVVNYLDDLVELTRTRPVTPELKKKIAAAEPVKLACLEVLASSKAATKPQAQKLLLFMVNKETDRALRLAALKTLGSSATGAKLIGEQFLAMKLPVDFRPQVIEAIRPHAATNEDVARILADVMKTGDQGPKE